MSKNVFVIGVVCILLGTTMVPVVDTVNIYTDSIPKTENIIQISGDGNTLYVGGSGPNNYTRIQDAIDNASDGDTVFVYDGTYYENLVIDKSINLMGQDRYIAIIDGRKYKDVIYICADGIIMSNFTIVNSGESDPWDAGIEGNASQIIIRDCNFYSNCYGIKILKNENKIINNIFRHNRYAIGCSSSNNLFQGNEIYRNNDGIDVASDNNTIIQNNIQQGSSGIYIDGWYNKVNGNVISQNMEGILISGSYNEILVLS
jgi:parallel beta-helix repeat protein